ADVDDGDLGPLHQRARLLDAADDLECRAVLGRRHRPVTTVRTDIPPERGHERRQPPLMGGGLVGRLGGRIGVAEIVHGNANGILGAGRRRGRREDEEEESREDQADTAHAGLVWWSGGALWTATSCHAAALVP